MTFAHAWVLHFLWLLPAVALARLAHHRQREKTLARFAEPGLLDRLTGPVLPGMRSLKVVLSLSTLGLMIFALSGPRWGSRYQEVSQKGVDIVILADVSPSMLVEDVKPNRLEQARREIHDFLQVVQGDRVGLVAFSGAAYVQCPLTLDYAALEMFLQALSPDLIRVAGTDLGAAIETGLSAFDPKAETDKVMLLITDGEDNEGRGQEAARKAAEKGAKIFVFGIGEAAGAPIPAGGQGGFKKDGQGNLVLSRMDEESLRKIAAGTGGTYVRSVAGDLDLDVLYFSGIRSRTTAQTLKSGKIRIEEERFMFFLLPAFLFLFIEGFVNERKPFRPLLFVAPLLLAALLSPGRVRAADDPDQLFRKGRYAEAEKAYAELDMDHPKEIRYRYNRGCAAFHSGDLQGAMAAFSSAVVRATEEPLRFRAAYNLGNVVFQQGDFAAAADYYRSALRHNPASEDARHNLELSLRKLAEQKKEQEKDQGKNQGKDQGQDQGKRQEQQGKDQGAGGEQQESSDKQERQGGSGGKEAGRKNPTAGDREGGDDDRTSQEGKPDQKTPTGELSPLRELPENASQEKTTGAAASALDKKMAEALLNSVVEDRTHLRPTGPGKRRAVRSGRDW